MKKTTALLNSLFTAGSIVAMAATAQAATIVSSFGDFSSATDNDNQAGPIRGVSYRIITTGTYTNPSVTQGSSSSTNSYTATHSLTNPNALATTVSLQSLKWQAGSGGSAIGAVNRWVAVFDSVTLDANGAVTGLGTLRAVSSNSVTNVGNNAMMTFNFANQELTVGNNYGFVLVDNDNSDNSGFAFAEISSANFELKTGTNLLQENTLIGANATGVTNAAAWEPVFELQYIPEPSSALLGGIGMLLLLRRRR